MLPHNISVLLCVVWAAGKQDDVAKHMMHTLHWKHVFCTYLYTSGADPVTSGSAGNDTSISLGQKFPCCWTHDACSTWQSGLATYVSTSGAGPQPADQQKVASKPSWCNQDDVDSLWRRQEWCYRICDACNTQKASGLPVHFWCRSHDQ